MPLSYGLVPHLSKKLSKFPYPGQLLRESNPSAEKQSVYFIAPADWTSRPGNNGKGGVLRIPQSSSITEASPSDCSLSYPGQSLRESNPSAEKQSVYSIAPADWTSRPGNNGKGGVLRIPQSSSITEASLSDRSLSYPGQSLRESNPSAEKQSVYSIAPADWTSRPGNNGKGGVLRIPQSSSLTEASLSDRSLSYPGQSLRDSNPSAEKQSVYSIAPADWTSRPGNNGKGGVLRIPQSSSLTEASLSDRSLSYPGQSLRDSNPSAEKQSVYSIAPADWTSRPGNNGKGGVLRIPQSSSITEASPSDCSLSYPGQSLRESNPSAEKQSVYSTAPADWAISLHIG